MKIDFEHIVVYTDLERQKMAVANEKKDFANIMYQRGQGLPFHALALKIYNSQGETEYDDEEYDMILKTAEAFYAPCFIDAIRSLKDDGRDKGV